MPILQGHIYHVRLSFQRPASTFDEDTISDNCNSQVRMWWIGGSPHEILDSCHTAQLQWCMRNKQKRMDSQKNNPVPQWWTAQEEPWTIEVVCCFCFRKTHTFQIILSVKGLRRVLIRLRNHTKNDCTKKIREEASRKVCWLCVLVYGTSQANYYPRYSQHPKASQM